MNCSSVHLYTHSEIPTFEQRLQNSHIHVALIVLADPEHSEQVRHPDDILNLVWREDAERHDKWIQKS